MLNGHFMSLPSLTIGDSHDPARSRPQSAIARGIAAGREDFDGLAESGRH